MTFEYDENLTAAPAISDRHHPDGETDVHEDDQADEDDADDDDFGAERRAHGVRFVRVTEPDVSVDGEGDDEPEEQKLRDFIRERDKVTPSSAVIKFNSEKHKLITLSKNVEDFRHLVASFRSELIRSNQLQNANLNLQMSLSFVYAPGE